MQCPERIIEEKRSELFKDYWKLDSLDLQQAYIRSCMTVIPPKYQYYKPKKTQKYAYHFTINGHKVRVCKKFFIATLDISGTTIKSVVGKKMTGIVDEYIRS